jgi:hypothetical protein
MGFAPHTVMFLARAARGIGALTLAAWVIDCGVLFYSGSGGASVKPSELFGLLAPTLALYALPGVMMVVCAKSVENGRPAGVAVIFIISVLSLFKLVILPAGFSGPYFDVPLYLELPVRGLCALLSVACAYAWPDLMDMRRMRNAPPRRMTDRQIAFPPMAAPTPTEQLPRPRPKRDEPPASQTPWF